MSREVKFRAKVLNTNNWIYRQPFHIRGTWYMYNQLWDMVPIEHKTIVQFSGLLDIKGNQIYDGDLLKDDENFIWEVCYKQGMFYAKCDDLLALQMLSTVNLYGVVVGNTYDNPELLEVAQ